MQAVAGNTRPPDNGDGESGKTPLIHARVSSGGTSTPYVQAGHGSPVVLLQSGTSEHHTIPLCFAELSRQFRVVAPVLEGGSLAHLHRESRRPMAFSTWLQGFLDGLGLARVSLVAGEAFGIPALYHALLDPDRVERVALLFRDAHTPSPPAGPAEHTFTVTGTSVMVVRLGSETEGLGASLAPLIRFLAGPQGPPREGVSP